METLWKPQPKQAALLSCPAFEIFYGGAAGGGKSDGLVAAGLQDVKMWGAHSRVIIFRQSRDELSELLERADFMYLPQDAEYRRTSKFGTNVYFFPNGGRVQFAYLEREEDVRRYQGKQFTLVGFDELGNYPTPYCWTYMQSRVRSAHGARGRIIGTGNPGGRGQGWIRQRFMDGKMPNRIYTREVRLRDNSVRSYTSVFIPSSLYDNRALMENDPDYEARLLSLPDYLRDALLNGSWEVFAGQVFKFDRLRHVRDMVLLDARYWFKFCSFDWGYAKPYALLWWAVNAEGRMYLYREDYGCRDGEYNVGIRKGSDTLARESFAVAMREGVRDIVMDPACWNEQDDKPSVAANFAAAGWNTVPANNDRRQGLVIFDQMLRNTDENGIPMLTVCPQSAGFIRTVPLLTPDPNRQEDIDTKLEDHIYDAARYAVMSEYAQFPTRYIAGRDTGGQRRVRESWDPFGRR